MTRKNLATQHLQANLQLQACLPCDFKHSLALAELYTGPPMIRSTKQGRRLIYLELT